MSDFDGLSEFEKQILTQGRHNSELLIPSTIDIARKCKITPAQVTKIVKQVSRTHLPPIVSLSELEDPGKFTTGCKTMDTLLGGGLRPCMVWEVVGESAAGKTQFALRSTLTVQLPKDAGGLDGAACYISTKSDVQTGRLMDMLDAHETLSRDHCSLDDIHHIKAPTIERLIQVLQAGIPKLVHQLEHDPKRKPLRLVVLDALAELFHEHGKMSTNTLVERSRNITTISALFHHLASKHKLGILVLNEVRDAVDFLDGEEDDLVYRHQSRLFSRADSLPNESRKEAQLGLVWANQINVRIMFSRTGRRRHLEHSHRQSSSKTPVTDEPLLIRRCTVVFSSVSQPGSVDYIVDQGGITCLDGVIPLSPPRVTLPPPSSAPIATDRGVVQLDIGSAVDNQFMGQVDYDTLFEQEDEFLGTVDLDLLDGQV